MKQTTRTKWHDPVNSNGAAYKWSLKKWVTRAASAPYTLESCAPHYTARIAAETTQRTGAAQLHGDTALCLVSSFSLRERERHVGVRAVFFGSRGLGGCSSRTRSELLCAATAVWPSSFASSLGAVYRARVVGATLLHSAPCAPLFRWSRESGALQGARAARTFQLRHIVVGAARCLRTLRYQTAVPRSTRFACDVTL
jgi:hypothetical protein